MAKKDHQKYTKGLSRVLWAAGSTPSQKTNASTTSPLQDVNSIKSNLLYHRGRRKLLNFHSNRYDKAYDKAIGKIA